MSVGAPPTEAGPAETGAPAEEHPETGGQRLWRAGRRLGRRLRPGPQPLFLLLFTALGVWMFAPAWKSPTTMTLEQVGIPDDLAARLEGKSSLGRLGLMTHSTAGFLDPGFTGHVTLELSNVANLPITLYPGMRIGQIAVFQLTTAAERPYGSRGVGSKYQGQRGPTPSRYWENFRSS